VFPSRSEITCIAAVDCITTSIALFAQFMNEKGLSVLLDNIEIRGIDQLKLMVEDWQQELAKQKKCDATATTRDAK